MQKALLGNSWLKANKPLRKGNLCNLLKNIPVEIRENILPFKVQNTRLFKVG